MKRKSRVEYHLTQREKMNDITERTSTIERHRHRRKGERGRGIWNILFAIILSTLLILIIVKLNVVIDLVETIEKLEPCKDQTLSSNLDTP